VQGLGAGRRLRWASLRGFGIVLSGAFGFAFSVEVLFIGLRAPTEQAHPTLRQPARNSSLVKCESDQAREKLAATLAVLRQNLDLLGDVFDTLIKLPPIGAEFSYDPDHAR
jgi:hypothetical protein